MIYKFQSQSIIANPVEDAQRRLKIHREKGTATQLTIFDVANLMDTILFSGKNNKANTTFEICFN